MAHQPMLRDCCWYHQGDWSLACSFTVHDVRAALAVGATASEVEQRVTAAVEASVADPWQAQAITSLILPISAMILDDNRAVIVDGHRRAFAMREQGVDETVVLGPAYHKDSEPTAS
jgi:hypothetical protein